MIKKITNILIVTLFIIYPLIVYMGLLHFNVRIVSLGLILLLSLRFVFFNKKLTQNKKDIILFSLIIGTLLISSIIKSKQLVLFIPTLINASLLISFGITLFSPPSMAEKFAQIYSKNISQNEIHYCKIVTGIWVTFFFVNGSVTTLLAIYAPLRIWTLYTGLISYILIGLLFGTELVYRYWRFRSYNGAPTDIIFKRIFPPKVDTTQDTTCISTDSRSQDLKKENIDEKTDTNLVLTTQGETLPVTHEKSAQ